jgi:hypothetical protein
MAAFWAVFTLGGSGPAITAHGSLDLKQEIQIQIQRTNISFCQWPEASRDLQNRYKKKSNMSYIRKYMRPKRVMCHVDMEE